VAGALAETFDLDAEIDLPIEPRPGDPGALGNALECDHSSSALELANGLNGLRAGELAPPLRREDDPRAVVRTHRWIRPRSRSLPPAPSPALRRHRSHRLASSLSHGWAMRSKWRRAGDAKGKELVYLNLWDNIAPPLPKRLLTRRAAADSDRWVMPETLEGAMRSVCVARTCSTSEVPIPNASAPNAPWVEVWLSPQTTVDPGWTRPISGPTTWTIPCRMSPGARYAMPLDAQFAASASSWARESIDLARTSRNRVVRDREGELGPPNLPTRRAKTREGLRRAHLLDEVEVDEEEVVVAGT